MPKQDPMKLKVADSTSLYTPHVMTVCNLNA